MAKKQNISIGKIGMDSDTHPSGLTETQYSYAKNMNLENESGNSLNASSEHSNILATKFKNGFKVIHAVNDIDTTNTYFFLVNPSTGVGEFGVVENNQNVNDLQDITIDCENCHQVKELADPLETIEQIALQTYTTLISDECHVLADNPEKGFMFNVLNPIKKSVIKNEKCGKTIYFSHKGNPPRHINIDKIQDYFTQIVSCSDDIVLDCPDFNKMRVFKLFDIPELLPSSIELGGNLRMGSYEFLVAYCDINGKEISEYYSLTNPILIFDENNQIQSQDSTNQRTNFSIKLNVEGLDENYSYYKIAVIQNTDIEEATRYFEEGVHPIEDKTVLYTTEVNKKEISVDLLFRKQLFVEEAEGVATANNILYQYGIQEKRELNLQPVINLLGDIGVKWQSHIAKEDLYKDGVLSSKYLSYTRDETVPLGIKFLLEGGYETAVFPLIGRQATTEDLEEVDVENLDRKSLEENKNSCNTSNRTQRYQIYNTATVDVDSCVTDVEYVEIVEEVLKSCTVEDIATVTANSITIDLSTEFTTLEDYINDNKGDNEASCDLFFPSNPEICDALYADYSLVTCEEDLFEGLDCTAPIEVSSQILVQEITGQGENGKELIEFVEKDFPEEYAQITPPKYCYLYTIGSDGKPERDESAPLGYEVITSDPVAVYVRDSSFINEKCGYANDIILNNNVATNIGETVFNNYYTDTVLANLLQSKTVSATSPLFNSNLHKGALWFKLLVDNGEKIILDIAKQRDAKGDDEINSNQELRISVFKTCSNSASLYSKIIDADNGEFFLFEKSGNDLKITDGANTTITIVNGWNTSNNFLISVDCPIYERTIDIDPDPFNTTSQDIFLVAPTNGCYTVTKREVENKSAIITWDSIIFKKEIELQATCTYLQPVINSCQAIPYKKGDFAYHQSEEIYPDNENLWDSSNLIVKEEDVPISVKSVFEERLATLSVDTYIWKTDLSNKPLVDYTCRNIRHFKFPDNKISPFMYDIQQPSFQSSVIFPIGITINEEVVNALLNIAVNNNLITQQDLEKIKGYEVVRGDMTLDRSIIASGLLFDMREYEEKGDKVLYSNYPFNSYAKDKFNLDGSNLPLSFDNLGESNNNYTFHSPETDYYKPTIPSEFTVQGYMYGKARINFDEVKSHPKYVVITSKARSLASTLATLEVVAEAVIASAQALSNFNPIAGVSTTIFPGGAIASGIIAGFSALSSAVFKYGRYRYDWLKVFQDLGTPHNFAYYYYAEGFYNTLNLEQEEENQVRGINLGKYLKDGRNTSTNEVTAERLDINNINREESVLISTGVNSLNYPTFYKNYDKSNSNASLTYLGENGLKETGKSSQIIRNIASPYIHLKNYLPSQYGTINSIRWISTGYRGDLSNPRTDCLSIFGGDTFISRHTLKRKHSQFLTNAMGQSDRTPFNYFFYNNIGRNPKFYLSAGVDKDFSGGGRIFPDIDNDFVFDNISSVNNYYTPPSKFYLYFYGIPNFLCETRINTNYRYAEEPYQRQFYPQVGDLGDWTQEKNVSIRDKNWFFYNKNYSRIKPSFKNRFLPVNYPNNCDIGKPNGILSSLPDSSENNDYDPWLIYRPLNIFEFPTNYGKLVDVQGIENEAILTRFENTSILYNKVDYTNDDGQNPTKPFLGGTSIFQRRSASFYNAQLGFGGTQNTSSISCEYGHFHVDAMRGQVIQTQPSGNQMEEISSIINGKLSGKRNWFKEHLPFKIKKYFKDVDVDNNYNGVGISMGWDSRYRRVFITKKDYIPKNQNITHSNGKFYLAENEISLLDSTYFENVSWTIAYSPVLGAWVSYYDFQPNYYISHNNYFQTGINSNDNKSGLWSHLLTNKSYNVFYGTKYAFEIELPIKSDLVNKKLEAVTLWTEVIRYENAYDTTVNNTLTFDSSIIWNNVACSGKLNLIPQKNNFKDIKNYPKTNTDNTQDILISNKDNFQWSYNYFFDRVKGTPFLSNDKNQINKTVNNSNISFTGNRVLKRLEGDWFLNRLSYSKDSRFKIIFKFMISTSEV